MAQPDSNKSLESWIWDAACFAAHNKNAARFVRRRREVKGAQLRNAIVNLCN